MHPEYRQTWNGKPESWIVRTFGADTLELRMSFVGIAAGALLLVLIGLHILR